MLLLAMLLLAMLLLLVLLLLVMLLFAMLLLVMLLLVMLFLLSCKSCCDCCNGHQQTVARHDSLEAKITRYTHAQHVVSCEGPRCRAAIWMQ